MSLKVPVLLGLLAWAPMAVWAQATGYGPASSAPVSGWPGSGSPFQPQVRRLPNGELRVSLTVPAHHALYRDRLKLQASNGWEVRPVWPAARLDADGHVAYTQDVSVDVPVTPTDPSLPLQVTLTHQGCEVDRLCYPPQTQTFTLPMTLPGPTLVVIGEDGCGGCVTLEAHLASAAVRQALKGWQVVRVNASQTPDAKARYGVRSFPTLRFYAAGEIADDQHGVRQEGAVATPVLLKLLQGRVAPPLAVAWIN